MADLRYVQPNRLRREVATYRKRLLLVGLPVLAVSLWIHVVLLFPGLIGLLILWGAKQQHLCGAEGEDRALGVPHALPGSLATLPDDYTVFNQVEMPNGDSFREIDFVVVGPNGIFAIEVKHARGEISGQENSPVWRQRKRSRAGNRYEQELRNPVRQLNGAIGALKQYLVSHKVHDWIQGIVVFTHPEVKLSPGTTSIPVVTLEGLAPYIRNRQPKYHPVRVGAIVRTLKRLRDDRLRPPHPVHISCFKRDFVTPEERLQGFPKLGLLAAVRKLASRLKPAPSPVPVTPASYPRPAPVRKRPRHFTVIQGGRAHAPVVKKIREVTLFVRRTETEALAEDDDDNLF